MVTRALLSILAAVTLLAGAQQSAWAQPAAGAARTPQAPVAGPIGGPIGGPVGLAVPGSAATPPSSAQPSAATTPRASPPIDSNYLLGAGDIIDLSLVGRGDFGGRVRVGNDGMILLPYIGVVKAADQTVTEIAETIRQSLIKGGYFADPVVRVEVSAISSRYVIALGAVGSQGIIPLDKNYHLSEMMAKLGGKSGGGADYVMVTHRGEKPKRYSYDKLAYGGPEDDPLVLNGDKIFVPSADSEVFYISGQVNAPGTYPLTEGLTIRKALAKAGGVTSSGNENKVKVTRDGKPIKGVKLDDLVKIDDQISIGERLF